MSTENINILTSEELEEVSGGLFPELLFTLSIAAGGAGLANYLGYLHLPSFFNLHKQVEKVEQETNTDPEEYKGERQGDGINIVGNKNKENYIINKVNEFSIEALEKAPLKKSNQTDFEFIGEKKELPLIIENQSKIDFPKETKKQKYEIVNNSSITFNKNKNKDSLVINKINNINLLNRNEKASNEDSLSTLSDDIKANKKSISDLKNRIDEYNKFVEELRKDNYDCFYVKFNNNEEIKLKKIENIEKLNQKKSKDIEKINNLFEEFYNNNLRNPYTRSNVLNSFKNQKNRQNKTAQLIKKVKSINEMVEGINGILIGDIK